MPNALLSPFWAQHHDRNEDKEWMVKMDCPVVKIQDGGQGDYDWVQGKRKNSTEWWNAGLPNALVVARSWAMGEQHAEMFADPVKLGKRHAQMWEDRRTKPWKEFGDAAENPPRNPLNFNPANTIVLGINEPKIWEPNGIPAVSAYTVAFLDECKRLGLRGGALQLSVGWPNNSGPDTLPVWDGFTGVEAAIKRGNHVLVTHEYWADKGPSESWGWWAGRVLKCPWQVPIVIGECGLEMAVKTGQRQGWIGICSAERYADMLVEYNNRMAVDWRIKGLCIFLCDYANKEWETLDVKPAYNAIIARKAQLAQPAKQPVVTPPPVVVPPVVTPPQASANMRPPLNGAPTVTQWFGENPAAYAKFGYRGHNGVDYSAVVGTPIHAVAEGTVAFVDNDPTGYGLYVRIYHKALNCYSMYGHMSRQDVKQGATVKQGDVIGLTGNTGNSTGPHLHYEIRLAEPTTGNYQMLPGTIGKGATDPVGFIAGLDRGRAIGASGGSTVFLPFVSA